MNVWAQAAITFGAMALLDFVWAKYTVAVTAGRALYAALLAAAIILCSGAAAIGYTQNPWMLLPAMAGAWVGTFYAVRSHK